MNKLGINLWNWVNSLDSDCLSLPSKIAQMGFTAIELPMTSPHIDEKLAYEVQKSGLSVSLCACMSAGRDISSFDETVRNSTKSYIKDCLKTGERLGATVFAGPLYAGGGKRHYLSDDDKKREWQLAVDGVREMAQFAAECGVPLALEPLNRYRTSVVNTAHQCLQLIDDIGEKNVGVHFDTYQAGIEEYSITGAMEDVLKAGKMAHFHACANNRGAPGQGFFPWTEIFCLLKRYGYNGDVTMETFAHGGLDSGYTEATVPPDALALAGLACMKQFF